MAKAPAGETLAGEEEEVEEEVEELLLVEAVVEPLVVHELHFSGKPLLKADTLESSRRAFIK